MGWQERTTQVARKDSPREPGRNIPCVEVVAGPASPGFIQLGETPVRLGRAPDCEIVIHDEDTSRHHARLSRTPDGIINVVDLQSTNGTCVNGTRIDVAALRDRDRIDIGEVTLRLVLVTRAELERRRAALAPPRELDRPDRLTSRQKEVVRFVAEGLTNSEIGQRLGISTRTVTTHLTRIYDRLEVSSRVAVALWATEHGVGGPR